MASLLLTVLFIVSRETDNASLLVTFFASTKELFVSYTLHEESFCINFETRFSPVFVQIFFSLVLYRVISKLRQSELGLLRLISRFRWLGFCFFHNVTFHNWQKMKNMYYNEGNNTFFKCMNDMFQIIVA